MFAFFRPAGYRSPIPDSIFQPNSQVSGIAGRRKRFVGSFDTASAIGYTAHRAIPQKLLGRYCKPEFAKKRNGSIFICLQFLVAGHINAALNCAKILLYRSRISRTILSHLPAPKPLKYESPRRHIRRGHPIQYKKPGTAMRSPVLKRSSYFRPAAAATSAAKSSTFFSMPSPFS